MSKPSDILNPDNPLLDSEEEDDDFEPEVPITNDGLFVKTRSGKGGDGDSYSAIEDLDVTLKRKAMSIFEDMQREDLNNNDMIKKKPRIDSTFKELMTLENDGISYFERLSSQAEEKKQPSEDLTKSIMEAIKELNETKNKGETKKVVKFAGESIEITGSKDSAQSLDTLVSSISSKKSLSAIDKSSYDWDKFKDKEGIKEEVEKAKENGFIEKQDFLSRVDQRQFEKERQQRERERIQRENEWRQRQHYECLLKETVEDKGERSSMGVSA